MKHKLKHFTTKVLMPLLNFLLFFYTFTQRRFLVFFSHRSNLLSGRKCFMKKKVTMWFAWKIHFLFFFCWCLQVFISFHFFLLLYTSITIVFTCSCTYTYYLSHSFSFFLSIFHDNHYNFSLLFPSLFHWMPSHKISSNSTEKFFFSSLFFLLCVKMFRYFVINVQVGELNMECCFCYFIVPLFIYPNITLFWDDINQKPECLPPLNFSLVFPSSFFFFFFWKIIMHENLL